MSLQWIADHFGKLQFVLLGMAIIFVWNNIRTSKNASNFKKREANRDDLDRLMKIERDLANAKIHKSKPAAAPLSLPGITLHGEPHEILDIAPEANESEIIRAYKDKIKKFHPDRIQGQAKDQMKFYEQASAKINQAKEAMISKLKK
jgi:DnaJ-class molecular chaperone